ncbi:MAG: efflux RND transporter permease subunit [Gemmatimonadetes bacterium]|nr:efflux RND transporter permease subunit [Gemmatimonadota bacterium]
MTDREAGRKRPADELPLDDPGFLLRFKEFAPTSFAVDHRTSMVVLLVIIAIMGLLSYQTTPKESFPEIEVPMIGVTTIYPGVSPADMESLISRPIEDELSTISDIKELTSSSTEGFSSVVAEFETNVDMEDALQKVREKVDLARPELPDEAEEPSVSEFDFSEVPIMQVNLSGDYGLVRLKDIADDLQDRLESISEVLRVDVRGGLEREVQVDVDLPRLKFYGLAISDVIDAIAAENVNIPGGSIDVGRSKYLVRVDGEFEDPTLIEDLVVTAESGRPVYVRDVASVDFGFAERDSYARLDGAPVITLDVIKRSGQNIIATSESVKEAIDEFEPLFPPSTVVKITSDQSTDIEMMVSSLENNIISGLILIVAVLLFFLGLANSGFVAVSIPSSMLLSFIVLKLMGVSMNMVVLFSLILALGMLVDNAIVVVENIYRYMEEGWESGWAAKKATGEVAVPVIASTATTLAAFAPLLFWPGITGEFMGYLPKTLMVTLSSSLFVALVIVPVLCAMFMRVEGEPRKPLTPAARWSLFGGTAVVLLAIAGSNVLTAVLLAGTAVGAWALYHFVLARASHVFQERWVPQMLDRYETQLRWALDHRLIIVGSSVAVLAVTVMAFTRFNSGIEYFPEDIPPKQVFVDVELPIGTRAGATDDLVSRLEGELMSVPGRTDWKSSVAVSGGGGGGGMDMGQGGPSGPNAGRVTLSYVDFQDRGADAFETLAWMQSNIGTEIAGAEVTVEQLQEGVQSGAPVNIEVVGEDPEQLKALSDRVLEILRNDAISSQLVGLESDLDAARPELSIEVDREKAALYELSTSDVGRAVRGAIQGVEAAKYRTGTDEYDIIVRLAPEYRDNLAQLSELTVMADGGRQIPLLSVADWQVGEGYGTIRRKDQERMATISSDVAAGLNSNAVLVEVQEVLAPFVADELPPGYTIAYTGQQEEQGEAQDFLGAAFFTALLLIAFILISQFNSVVKPFIIMTSVMMSTIGVFMGLMVFRMPFGVIMTGVGIISLAGIVVNNAIVLIDYIDILRERDAMDRREALVQGGKTRFRPVVLTATTTALGLVPLAVGLNFDFFGLYTALQPELFWGGEQAAWWGPMAVAVIVGIIFATFLTLVLVPVMYSLVDDFTTFFRRWFVAPERDDAVAVPSPSPAEPPFEVRVPPRVAEPEPAQVFRTGLRPRPEAG